MPTRMIRRLRAITRGRDDGVTLTELLVSMGLSTLLGAVTVTLFLNINTSSSDTTDRTINSSSARNTIQAWTGYLRVADGTPPGTRTNRLGWLAPNDMLLFSDVGNRSMSSITTTSPPIMIWLRLDSAGQLVEEQFTTTPTSGGAIATVTAGTRAKVCRVLASHVSVRSALFTPSDSLGSPLTSMRLGTAPTSAAGCQPLPVAVPAAGNSDPVVKTNLQNVNSVVIDFIVRDTGGQHPLEFMSNAVLPALGAV
ncbi:MAG TPA: hypothetical protein VHS54_00620 [Jatrophihabitans sp.]|jgi:hypothetical protein|nr:hypothetical protein [Jatrophihabitans sp.]